MKRAPSDEMGRFLTENFGFCILFSKNISFFLKFWGLKLKTTKNPGEHDFKSRQGASFLDFYLCFALIMNAPPFDKLLSFID